MEYINKKVIVLVLFYTSLLFMSCSGQETPKGAKKENNLNRNDSIENQIKGIRKEYNKINSDSLKFRVVQEDIEGESTEGGLLKKFYDGNILRKAVLIFFGETGKSVSEYYFQNAQIVFVYQTEERYKSPIYRGKVEVKSRDKNRFYFNGGKLIRWIDNDGKIVDKQLYSSKEKEILDTLKNIH